MPDPVHVTIDGRACTVAAGISVAAAIASCGNGTTRRSPSGALRAPLCGMGVCQECRVSIDGRAHMLACRTPCVDGMRIDTGGRI